MNGNEKLVVRVSIGFTKREWEVAMDALKIVKYTSRKERTFMIRNWIWAVSIAIKKDQSMPTPLAVEMRHETKSEMDDRMRPRTVEDWTAELLALRMKGDL